jgi:hypothetical protein
MEKWCFGATVVAVALGGQGCGGMRRPLPLPDCLPTERFEELARAAAAKTGVDGEVQVRVKPGIHKGRAACLVLVQAVPGGPGRHRAVILSPAGDVIEVIRGQ